MKSLRTPLSALDRDQLGVGLSALLASVVCGLAISKHSPRIAIAIPALALGAALLPLVDAGVLVGLGLVCANNAAPGVDLAKVSLGEVNGTDIAFLAILAFAIVRRFSAPSLTRSHPLSTLLRLWSVGFLAVWFLAFIRALDAGTDVVHAASVGRDFLYFGLALPFAGYLFSTERELYRCCAVLAVASFIIAAILILVSLGALPGSITNAQFVAPEGSLTRIYTPAYYLLELTFALSCAYALLHTGRRARVASVVAAVNAAAIALSLTRALYVGVVLALGVSLVIWAVGQPPARSILRRRLLITASAAALLGACMFLTVPGTLASGPVHSVLTRAGSMPSEFSSADVTTSDLAYRVKLDSLMVRTLGARWPLGLGFLSPHTNYFADFPQGSIRNTDTGVFNSIMTVGVVGTVLLFFAPLAVLWSLLRRVRWAAQPNTFLWLGGTIWLLIVLISSYTLASLASVSGLATTTVGLGILIFSLSNPTARPGAARAGVS
jgi:hypothetical protein